MFGNTPKVIVIEKGEPLTKEQYKIAFSVGEHSLFWRAIIQIIEEYRLNSADNSFAACGENNPMSVAAALGAQEVLTNLLADLSKRREEAVK